MDDLSHPEIPAEAQSVLQDAFDALQDGISLWDSDRRLVLMNARYAELFLPPGFPMPSRGTSGIAFLKELFGTGYFKLAEGSDVDALVAQIAQLTHDATLDLELERRDGRILSATSSVTTGGARLVTVRDISQIRGAAEVEARKLELIQDAVSALDEGVALIGRNLTVLLTNAPFAELILPDDHGPVLPGTRAHDLFRGSAAEDAQTPEKADAFAADITRWITALGAPREQQTSSGRVVEMRVSKTALGEYLLIVADVTAARQTERQARDMLYEAFQSLDEGLVLCDGDMRFVFGNDAWHRMMFDREDRIPPRPGESAVDNLIAHVKSGYYDIPVGMSEMDYVAWMMGEMSQHGKQVPYRSADGRHFIGSSHLTSYGGALMFIRDVTEQHNTEEKARDIMLNAIQSLDEGLALLDRDLRFVYGNAAWYDMFYRDGTRPEIGTPVEEMMLQGIAAGTHAVPESLTDVAYAAQSIEALKSHTRNYRLPLSDGRILIGSSHETELDGYLISFRDITEEQRAEEKRLQAVTDALNAADYPMVLFGADKRFVLANASWYDMITPIGIDPKPGDDGEYIFWQMIDRDYYILPNGLSKRELHRAGLNFIYGYNREFPLQTSDGKLFLGSSSRTAMGGYLLSYRDITEQTRTEAELAESRETAHQNEKLSALGELLAGVAHELNNPLSVVFGYSQMLQGKVADPVLAERIDLICQSAERAAKIVKTFLAMARQRPTKIELCSINDIAATALEVSSYSLKSNGTRVLTDFAEYAPPVSGDFDQLAQVFSNLIINAGHAVEPQRSGGEIVVRSFYDPEGDQTVVEIRDNGPGIPLEIQTRIFEPFFTTKDVGEGTGVGLAFSHRIVKSHEGVLDLRSEVGRGASFFVRLAAASDPIADDQVSTAETRATRPRRVLVIDDEAGVARLIADLLGEEGFIVTTSTSPRDALRLAEQQAFDVVLSDFKMPDMDGQAFFQALSIVAPKLASRTGFITGDAMSAQVRGFLSASGRPHIEKPIIRDELISLVAEACSDMGGER